MTEMLPLLIAMGVLILASAFFSASEAALFYLRTAQRTALSVGTTAQRTAVRLLEQPDRLLTAVLFWNLVANMAYFALASSVSLHLEKAWQSPSAAFMFGACSLLVIISFSEMLPKSLAVIAAPKVAALVSVPLSLAVRAVDPIQPLFRLVNLLSQRLLWPRFTPEALMEVSDLERAISLSTSDEHLMEQEQTVLHNIVSLSTIRVDEWMRPRTQFLTFRPPVALADLKGKTPPSGYILITEADSEEVAASVPLREKWELPEENLHEKATPAVFVPWCATLADAFEEMQKKDRDVAAVLNEYGETIGVITYDDLLDFLLIGSSRSDRLQNRQPIREAAPGVWHVSGMTGLRRLGRFFKVELPTSKSVTVAGVLQETLQKLAEEGDECDWGPFHLKVIQSPKRRVLLIELTHTTSEEPA